MRSRLNEDATRFGSLGYCVARRVLHPATVSRHRGSVERMVAGLEEGRRPESLVEPQIRAPDWRDWLELCRDAKLLASVREILGSDELLVLSSHILAKPPRDGLAVAWHQDNTYWPGVSGTGVLTAWVALDDVDGENGCMRFLPGSHAGHPELEMLPTGEADLLGVRVEIPESAEESAVAIELSAGDVSFHDSFLIHASHANHSARWRVAYTIRYADAATTRVDLERHGKPVYCVSGADASVREGYRDIRPGRELPADPGEHRSNRSARFRKL